MNKLHLNLFVVTFLVFLTTVQNLSAKNELPEEIVSLQPMRIMEHYDFVGTANFVMINNEEGSYLFQNKINSLAHLNIKHVYKGKLGGDFYYLSGYTPETPYGDRPQKPYEPNTTETFLIGAKSTPDGKLIISLLKNPSNYKFYDRLIDNLDEIQKNIPNTYFNEDEDHRFRYWYICSEDGIDIESIQKEDMIIFKIVFNSKNEIKKIQPLNKPARLIYNKENKDLFYDAFAIDKYETNHNNITKYICLGVSSFRSKSSKDCLTEYSVK